MERRDGESKIAIATALLGALATIFAACLSAIGLVPAFQSWIRGLPTSSPVATVQIATPSAQMTFVPPTPIPTLVINPTPVITPTPVPSLPTILVNESVFTTLIAALATIAGSLVTTLIVLARQRQSSSRVVSLSAERIQKLIRDLSQSSTEADLLIQEIVTDIRNRGLALAELQSRNVQLASQEAELKKRIDVLKDVPLEVAQYFDKITQQNLRVMERRGSRRDFQFFIFGTVVSAIIAIILRLLGLG